MPLSSGYDLIGKKPRINRFRAIRQEEDTAQDNLVVPECPVEGVVEPVEESETPEIDEDVVVEEVIIPEPTKEEPSEDIKQGVVVPEVPTIPIPEPEDIPVQEEKVNYYEIDYETLPVGNAVDKLPESESGNYVIIYRSDNCIYCDKLINELKGNTGDYVLVVVKCKGTVRDPFYTRLVYNYFPSFIVIKNKVVKYYGYGYRTLEAFKRFL